MGTKAPTLYRASCVCVRGLRRAGWELVWEAEPWAEAPASLSPVPSACEVMEEKAETGPIWPVPPSLLHCSNQETPKRNASSRRDTGTQHLQDVCFPSPICRFSKIPILEEELLAVIFKKLDMVAELAFKKSSLQIANSLTPSTRVLNFFKCSAVRQVGSPHLCVHSLRQHGTGFFSDLPIAALAGFSIRSLLFVYLWTIS